MTVDINRIRGKGILLPVAVVSLTIGFACDSPAPGPAPLDTSSTTASGYRVSGVVTDDRGAVISGARVVVDHGPNLPDLNEGTRRVATTAGADGRYEIFFRADQVNVGYHPFAMIRAFTLSSRLPGEYSSHAQLLDEQGVSSVTNIRLRRARILSAGQSTSVAIESDSSLCDIRGISATTICEWVSVRYPTDGTLTVEARPDAGSIVPTVQGWSGQGHGTLTLPVTTEDFDFVNVAIVIPRGMAPQRYEVSTTLRR